MAPEAYLGENYTECCDLYSFGIVLWEIFAGTGDIPFQALMTEKTRTHDMIDSVVNKNVRPLCGEDFPIEMVQLIQRLWVRDPACRPPFAKCVKVLQHVDSALSTWEPFVQHPGHDNGMAAGRFQYLESTFQIEEPASVFYAGRWRGRLVSLVGTELGGVFVMLSRTSFKLIGRVDGSPVSAMALDDEDGTIWCGAANGALHWFALPSASVLPELFAAAATERKVVSVSRSRAASSARASDTNNEDDGGGRKSDASKHSLQRSQTLTAPSSRLHPRTWSESRNLPLPGSRPGSANDIVSKADPVDELAKSKSPKLGESRTVRSHTRASHDADAMRESAQTVIVDERQRGLRDRASSESESAERKSPRLAGYRSGSRPPSSSAAHDGDAYGSAPTDRAPERQRSATVSDPRRGALQSVSVFQGERKSPRIGSDPSQLDGQEPGERKSPRLGGSRAASQSPPVQRKEDEHGRSLQLYPLQLVESAAVVETRDQRTASMVKADRRKSPFSSGGANMSRSVPGVPSLSPSALDSSLVRMKKGHQRERASQERASTQSNRSLHSARITCIVVMGVHFVSVDASGTVAISARDRVLSNKVLRAPLPVVAICAVSDSAAWVACGRDILLLQLESERLIPLIHRAHTDVHNIRDMVYGTADRMFTCTEREIKIWAVSTLMCLRSMSEVSMATINCLSLASVHGEVLLWSGGLNELRCWDATSGRLLKAFRDIGVGEVERVVEIGEDVIVISGRRCASLVLIEWDLFL